MAIKTKLLFLSFLIFAVLLALFIKPDTLEKTAVREIPLIEFGVFQLYNITKNGTLEALFGETGEYYAQRNIVKNGLFYRETNKKLETISGDSILFQGDLVSVSGGAHYVFAPYDVTADFFTYNSKTQILRVPQDFRAKDLKNTLTGKDLRLNAKHSRASAKNIHIEYFAD
ncbi:MAG: hypothetical protein ACTTIC_01650 [Helicobacteraceae bacterium]